MRPRIRPPHVLTATGLAGFLLLFSFNIRNLFDNPNDWSAVRSDLRMGFIALFLVGIGWFGLWYALDTFNSRLQTLQRANGKVWSSREPDERTYDLGPHLRVVGTAAVATGGLTDYDKGYVDCLVDKPLKGRDQGHGQVIPIDRGRP